MRAASSPPGRGPAAGVPDLSPALGHRPAITRGTTWSVAWCWPTGRPAPWCCCRGRSGAPGRGPAAGAPDLPHPGERSSLTPPLGAVVKQSGNAPRITRIRSGQEGPNTGVFTVHPFPFAHTPAPARRELPASSRRWTTGCTTQPPMHRPESCPPLPPNAPPGDPLMGVPFPVFLRVGTPKHREHWEQTGKTHVTHCRHWIFMFPVAPGTNANRPGTPGTT